MKNLWKLPKGKAILIGAAAAATAVIALGAYLIFGARGYITIRVYDINGTAEIRRQNAETIDAYVNMLLESGDRGTTGEDSWLYLLVDDDKYIMAEPETVFSIRAEGDRQNSRINLDLEVGALVTHVTKPLNDQSSYEISTPNSTMAVRGTSYRVVAWIDELGVTHAQLEVFDGVVEVYLVYPDGSRSKEPVQVSAGETIRIWGDNTTTEIEYYSADIDYYGLDIPDLEFLRIGIENLINYDITDNEVTKIIEVKQKIFEVRFMADGRLFATQSVPFDGYAHIPSMQPGPSGSWAFAFDTPIREDTDIQWVAG